MASLREFINDCLANYKCRGELKAKSDAEILVGKLCEKLDEMGGGGIKTVVVKGVIDETTGSIVYTPNMTYEEVRDMMLNLEPFNMIFIAGFSPDNPWWEHIIRATYDAKNNCIVLNILSSSTDILWNAAGFGPGSGQPKQM